MPISNMKSNLRYAYIKNGDAVVQVKRLTPLQKEGPTSGPDAFIHSLLCSLGDSPVLVLSRFDSNGRFKYKNIDAHVIKVTGNLLQKIILRILSIIWMLSHLLVYKPDRILCGTTGEPLWVSYIVAKLFRIPLVHSRHNSIDYSARGLRNKVVFALDNLVLKKISAFIVHGPFLRDQLKSVGIPADRIYEFDVGFEDMMRRDGRINGDSFPSIRTQNKIILYTGRIEKVKGVMDLLEAASDLFNKDKQLILIYAGDGFYKETLLKEIESRALNKRVMVLGYIAHDKLVSLLRKCRVLVTPTQKSFPEGRCMSAMEGLVMGIPVIAPDSGPFPYLVKHGVNGLLYKVDCVGDLKEKLSSVVVDNNLYNVLRAGARETSKRLIRPTRTFGEAVECAFLL